jgi:hypothetical protein
VAAVFVFTLAFGAIAQAQTRVDRDFGALHKHDANQFGDDRAYTSASSGIDRDMDNLQRKWTPNTYGLGGDYGYDSGGPN